MGIVAPVDAPRAATPAMGQVQVGEGFAEPRSSTLVMGQVSAGFAEPRSSTQVMGQVSADFAEPRSSTQVMGQVSADFAEPRSSTQVMGQVSADFAEPRSSTQVMGQVSADFAEPRSSTQVMGQVSADFAEPRSSTQVMGQVSEGFAEPRSSTQVMGQVSADFAEPRSSTQVMGQVSEGFAEPRSSTQVMGQVSEGFAEPRSSTQVMGQVSEGFAEPRSSTQVMGQVAGGSAEPRSSTQVMGQVSGGFKEPRSATLIMGGAAAPASGLLDVPLHGDGAPPQLVTQLEDPFGVARSSTPAMGMPGPARRETLSFGALDDDFGKQGPRATAEMGLVLPIEPLDSPLRQLHGGATVGGATSARIGGAEPEGSSRSKWIVLVVLLAAVGFAGWKFLGAERQVPEDAVAAHDAAMRMIRRDDPATLSEAGTQLSGLVQQHAGFVRARADQAVVLALRLDDQKARADAQHAAQAGLRMQIEALERAKSPGDWQNRVNAIRDALTAHDQTLLEIQRVETGLQKELLATLDGLPAVDQLTVAEDRIAVTRARLFGEAVSGSTEALALLSRFQQEGGAEAWQQVAYATYILNARGGQSSGLAEAREGLAEVKTSDAVWLRPYVLSARLARSAGDVEDVRTNLEAALTLNPKHTLAEELKGLLPEE